ncbi:uncharacterized protein LOC118755621 [Rhagoletis pomonella]|uniref:uncharacterized protein LOC118755621 n=1 Tax=Rhagoletis pomonella TaxID=28610 RepID=UPI00177B00F7|nr:uncharacterized protein LOC118755621 [Rhagoletis pomonella]
MVLPSYVKVGQQVQHLMRLTIKWNHKDALPIFALEVDPKAQQPPLAVIPKGSAGPYLSAAETVFCRLHVVGKSSILDVYAPPFEAQTTASEIRVLFAHWHDEPTHRAAIGYLRVSAPDQIGFSDFRTSLAEGIPRNMLDNTAFIVGFRIPYYPFHYEANLRVYNSIDRDIAFRLVCYHKTGSTVRCEDRLSLRALRNNLVTPAKVEVRGNTKTVAVPTEAKQGAGATPVSETEPNTPIATGDPTLLTLLTQVGMHARNLLRSYQQQLHHGGRSIRTPTMGPSTLSSSSIPTQPRTTVQPTTSCPVRFIRTIGLPRRSLLYTSTEPIPTAPVVVPGSPSMARRRDALRQPNPSSSPEKEFVGRARR